MSRHKKTRQEKIIADLRRKLSSSAPSAQLTTADKNPEEVQSLKDRGPVAQSIAYKAIPTINNINIPSTNKQEVVSSNEFFDYSYVYRDLRKTLVLTVLAIGFELVLFSIWHYPN